MSSEFASFTIESQLVDRIAAVAARGYPEETCGFLLGSEDRGARRVTAIVVADNRESAEARRKFLVDKTQYEAAEAEAERTGQRILGVFHSHPDAEAVPSPTDSEFAFPGWIYWISPVGKGVAGTPRVWLRLADATNWQELTLETV